MFCGFIGNYTQTLDQKNRLVVPARFRAFFEAGTEPPSFYITRGQDKCVLMFTSKQWRDWKASLRAVTGAKEMKGSVRDYGRMVYANAHFCMCDKLGRITIPPALVEYAGLKRELTIIGVENRMEIWSTEKWNEYQERVLEDFENLTEDIYQSQ